MSFFIVGKPDSKDFQKRIEGIFDNLKFLGENRKLDVCTASSFAYCQSPSKVIDDIFIQPDKSSSWLLLVGAPVIAANTDADKQDFANKFFHDPGRVLRYQIRHGSGGRGLRSGGNGIIREFEFLKPATVTLLTERRRHQPWGLKGGSAGARGENWINQHRIGGKESFQVRASDRVTVKTPGGGGWGCMPE